MPHATFPSHLPAHHDKAVTPPHEAGSFSALGLMPELLAAIEKSGYTVPTPIQVQTIPLALAGQDILGGAQTGTGKTAAFALPVLQRLLPFANTSPSPAKHPARALILTPTRELAQQVFESVCAYASCTSLRTMCAYGGVDIRPQIEALRQGAEILVATPGRLLDLVTQKAFSPQTIQALVLDEADRMLDMGFIPDIRRILEYLPQKRQSLLFSATFSEEIRRLADFMLKSPVSVDVARRNQVSETIAHRVYPVSEQGRRALLIRLLKSGEIGQCIVFTRTRQDCARLTRELQRSHILADAIHGDKSQPERLKTLAGFKSGEISVLVATDVAARGLDIEDLPHVINYELPHVPEDYVHRIGRTGRAGRMGQAISLVSAAESAYLAGIEKLVGKPIERVTRFEADDGKAAQNQYGMRGKSQGMPQGAPTPFYPPRAAPKTGVAPDGFDFSKPYVPVKPLPTPTLSDPLPVNSSLPPGRPRKIIAALLGGLGRKT